MPEQRRFSVSVICGAGLLFFGCRVGYEELASLAAAGANATGGAGGVATGGTGTGGVGTGGIGTGGGLGEAGEGGESAAGGSSGTGTGGSGGVGGAGGSTGGSLGGGRGGSSASGGSGDEGGMGATGGTGGAAGAGTGGASGDGGTAGTSGAGGASGSGGASGDGGMSGAGAGGTGGFAGATSLGDCRTLTFNTHDYVFCNEQVVWTVARDGCASIGMQLVRVDDPYENQWLYDNRDAVQLAWLGASDIAVEGEWRWLDGDLFWLGDDTGSAQNSLYNAWYPSQPQAGLASRDCAVMDVDMASSWNSVTCSATEAFVCESL